MAEKVLDITGEVCPMTFVKVKIFLERLAPGEEVVVRLNGGEPLENIPRSLRDEGYSVSEPLPEGGEVYRIRTGKPPP